MPPAAELGIPHPLVVWSARLMVACWLVAVLVKPVTVPGADAGNRSATLRPWQRRFRLIWTFGSVVCLVHILLALALAHGWSNHRAWLATAAQTKAVLGLATGDGLYANYVFCLIWLADAAGWWLTGVDPLQARPRLRLSRELMFLVMMFFATVAFGPWFWRPVALAAAGLWLLRRQLIHRRKRSPGQLPSVRGRPPNVD